MMSCTSTTAATLCSLLVIGETLILWTLTTPVYWRSKRLTLVLLRAFWPQRRLEWLLTTPGNAARWSRPAGTCLTLMTRRGRRRKLHGRMEALPQDSLESSLMPIGSGWIVLASSTAGKGCAKPKGDTLLLQQTAVFVRLNLAFCQGEH